MCTAFFIRLMEAIAGKKQLETWKKKSDGTGNGPSLRWVSVMHYGSKTLYLLGSSVGLFATDSLNGLNTTWKQIGANSIGNAIVDMIVCRETDGNYWPGYTWKAVFLRQK